MKQREFMTAQEIADMLAINPATVYREVAHGALACYQVGRIKRFRRADVETYLESRRIENGKAIINDNNE